MKPVSATDLMMGKPLRSSIYDRTGKLLLERVTLVQSQGQMNVLLDRGFFLNPEEESAAVSAPTSSAGVPLVKKEERIQVFEGVRALADELKFLHSRLLARQTENFSTAIFSLVQRLEELANRDSDAALASMQLHVSEEGVAVRQMHAAVLCRTFLRALKMDAAQQQSVLAAALTYDVSLAPIAQALNRQKEPLSNEQRVAIDAHPADAYDLLREAGVEDEVWLDAVRHHHERLDGKGYPDQLEGDAISLPGRVLSIVDTFSAMIRPRAYRDAVLTRQALRDIFADRVKSVDANLANIFVKELGMYPPGSLVRLANREIAIVVRRGTHMGHPEVRVVINPDDSLALRFPERDTSQEATAVIEALPIQKYRSILTSIYGLWKAS